MARTDGPPPSCLPGAGVSRGRLALLLCLLWCMGSCKLAVEEAVSEPATSLIASINGRLVSQEEFRAYLGAHPTTETQSPTNLQEQFRDFLTQRILLDRAEEKGITVTEAELREQIGPEEEGQKPNPWLVDRLRAFLKIQKLLKSEIGPQIDVSFPEMRNHYENHKERFVVQDRVRVLEIRIRDRKRAEEMVQRLTPNDLKRFEEMARLHSEGSTAEWGGRLGVFERGELPHEFEQVVFNLKPGEISELVRSHRGYHIFMVEERTSRHPQRFYEVQAGIFEELAGKQEMVAMNAYVQNLLDSASIQIHDKALNFEGTRPNARTKN